MDGFFVCFWEGMATHHGIEKLFGHVRRKSAGHKRVYGLVVLDSATVISGIHRRSSLRREEGLLQHRRNSLLDQWTSQRSEEGRRERVNGVVGVDQAGKALWRKHSIRVDAQLLG